MGHSDPRPGFAAAVRGNLDRLRGPPGPGVVAVSGGADSAALLCALAADPLPGGLVVAHLNHRLRGLASDADAAFVASLFPTLPHRVEAIDIRSWAGTWRRRPARSATTSWPAWRPRRGRVGGDRAHGRRSGRNGPAPPDPRERAAGPAGDRRGPRTGARSALVRPLLTVSRQEVIAYLRAAGQAWREDETNRDPAFTRNRIRHELLPLLPDVQPGHRGCARPAGRPGRGSVSRVERPPPNCSRGPSTPGRARLYPRFRSPRSCGAHPSLAKS